jgi:hypothetical protein
VIVRGILAFVRPLAAGTRALDYEVFLLSRIRERYDETGDNTAAVAAGLQRTGGLITSLALLLVIVGLFSASSITFLKLLGVGMIVAGSFNPSSGLHGAPRRRHPLAWCCYLTTISCKNLRKLLNHYIFHCKNMYARVT